jgi:predicted AAA+ superfamily ATPase
MNGAFFENYTVAEWIKSHENCGKRPFLYYYRDRDAKEIDLVVEQNRTLYPLEIKKTANPGKRMLSAFSVLTKSGLPVGVGALLCMAEAFSAFDRDHLIIPVSLI